MSYRASFRCIAGCSKKYPLDQIIYRCETCSELLEVVHEGQEDRSPREWMELFDQRRRGPSGVWAKREWVHPELRDENIVSLGEGATSLLPCPRYGRELGVGEVFMKQCGNSHTGSFKDLGMTVLVSSVKQLIADGLPIKAVACASTGDTSAALAAYAAAAGIRALVILPRGKISPAQLVQPLANGALVLALDTDFDCCMAIVQQLAAEEGVYLANSMNSLRIEGQKTVAIEIAQQLGWQIPDWVVIPGGNLGNVSALGAGFTMLKKLGLTSRLPRICVAQTEAANPLYRSFTSGFADFEAVTARPTLASAIQIGNPVSVKKAIRTVKDLDGVVEQASETELANAAARADRFGMFTCPHTGVALAALEKLVARGQIMKSERVAVVSTANGLKFTDFKTGYHVGRLAGVSNPQYANRPVELPHGYNVVRDEVRRQLEQPAP